jgi:hypothetical protein
MSNSVENSDVAEIGTTAAQPASFVSVWLGPDFQAFRRPLSDAEHQGE